jgi:lipopolysaccharide biosynthesis regulator YciM
MWRITGSAWSIWVPHAYRLFEDTHMLDLVSGGLFWMLLPLAALSGWYVAGRQNEPDRRSESFQFSPDYFRGLNYLLNEQPDKAIEVFIKMLDVESETVETHLALGNLFRRRGEVDRAIRIHQNLVARENLDKEERALALLELGLDYMRSGLLDRAESLFQELLSLKMYELRALQQLADIYQQEQDWEKAIDTNRQLERQSGQDLSQSIAHMYLEQAEELIELGNFQAVEQRIAQALEADPKCVRASLMQAGIAKTDNRLEDAIAAYQRVEAQDPEYLQEMLSQLLECYRGLSRFDEFQAYLDTVVTRHAGISPVLLRAELAKESGDLEQAVSYIGEELRRRPSLRGLDRLVEYSMLDKDSQADSARAPLRLLREFTTELMDKRPVYSCTECGFAGKSLHWQCPGCQTWNTVKPIHGIEGE